MSRQLASALIQIVDAAAATMLTIADDVAAEPRAPGAWSRKEIVGHLIDSATNNQVRFVRAQLQAELVFDGYDQDAWVRVQRYAERPWTELVETWRSYNHQVAAIIAFTPTSELDRPRGRHNLNAIGYRPLPTAPAATLGSLMRDYVAHLEHHVAQVVE